MRKSTEAEPGPATASPRLLVEGAGVRFGRFELVTRLGSGGMAEVFLARAVGLGGFERQVVIKRVIPRLADNPEFVAMFIDEARIMGLLHHEAIAQVYDFGVAEGVPFLALEYIDGVSLQQIQSGLRRQGRSAPLALAAYIAREVCRALDYVHGLRGADGTRLDIVHRDVTPSNIMLTLSGAVKLLDFGVAKAALAAHLTATGVVKGKHAYMAPEQARAQPIDRRADVFAVGIVLWEMLCGERLFSADNDLATMHLILEKPIARPSLRRPELPPALDDIVLRALARRKEERYPTAGEMAKDLDAIVMANHFTLDQAAALVAEVRTAARDPSARGESRRKEAITPPAVRPGPVRRWMMALAGLAIGGVAVAVLAMARRSTEPPPLLAPAHAPAAPVPLPPASPLPSPAQPAPIVTVEKPEAHESRPPVVRKIRGKRTHPVPSPKAPPSRKVKILEEE